MRPLYSSLKNWEARSSLADHVILVDEKDLQLGTMEKMQAHREGLLHRAFSIFIFNSTGDMLLQKRAQGKYHSAGLWTNACCSHPRPGEPVEQAARRRLQEELGFQCELKPLYEFTYRAEMENGLVEHEYDHVFLGNFEGGFEADPREVSDWKYGSPLEIAMDLKQDPGAYTEWFGIAFPAVMDFMKELTM